MRRTVVSLDRYASLLKALGLEKTNSGCFDGKQWSTEGTRAIKSINAGDGSEIAQVTVSTRGDYDRCVKNMKAAIPIWQQTPAPKRGEIVRQIGEAMRAKLEPLSDLVSLEVGKIKAEGRGEVQEYIDICDYATGLSRIMSGQVLNSERPKHFMMESWHPLGSIGIISAFNFPVAVSGWNTAISFAAGNVQIWKGAPSTPLCSVATQKIVTDVLQRNGFEGVATLITGETEQGKWIVDDPFNTLISFTGSCEAGGKVGEVVARRFGKTILELGGNNAIVVMDDADLTLATRSVLFAAVGTAGQRCTTTRRLLVQKNVYSTVLEILKKSYSQIRIGNPLDADTLLGPLHRGVQVENYKAAIAKAVEQGGKIEYGGKVISGTYVEPTIISINPRAPIVQTETFAPILYISQFETLEEAIELNNSVPQGLSSSLFTTSQPNMFQWVGARGSDCGVVNVNIPTSGAEIGGAFGGEKATGGGREAGSDSWKQYCRRVTSTINFSKDLPLAQGIKFE